MINDFAVARALHVLALVHWIGGVAMVTTIVLPRARALANAHAALAAFDAFEAPFATQARFSILLAGLSGFYMLNKNAGMDAATRSAVLVARVDGRGVGSFCTGRVRARAACRPPRISRLRAARQGSSLLAGNPATCGGAHNLLRCDRGRGVRRTRGPAVRTRQPQHTNLIASVKLIVPNFCSLSQNDADWNETNQECCGD